MLVEQLSLFYGLEEINSLVPVSFSWKEKRDTSIHYGLLDHVDSCNIPEIHGCHCNIAAGTEYLELIPIMVKAIQELVLELDKKADK